MKDLTHQFKKQTRLYQGEGPEERGNCMAAVIASIIGLEVEEAFQYQLFFDQKDYLQLLLEWLNARGWDYEKADRYKVFHHDHVVKYAEEKDYTWLDIKLLQKELKDDYYLVSGESQRGVNHICIYQNEKMVWDPHPDNTGLVTKRHFSILVQTNT